MEKESNSRFWLKYLIIVGTPVMLFIGYLVYWNMHYFNAHTVCGTEVTQVGRYLYHCPACDTVIGPFSLTVVEKSKSE